MSIRRVRTFFRIAGLLWCGVMLLTAGCQSESGSYLDASASGQPLYGESAHRAFSYEGPLRNPVVVIHGLLGARLENAATGENLWGDFSLREMRDPVRLAALALPMKLNTPLSKLGGGVRPTGILSRATIRVLGLEFELNNYETILRTLTASGYAPESPQLPPDKHFPSLYEFAYDWRRDISENAAALGKFLQARKRELQMRYQQLYHLRDYPVKFDLIGHSMGGLVARYYAMYGDTPLPADPERLPTPNWAGKAEVSRVIMIGTPNRGYGDTLWELVHGLRLTSGAPLYPPELIGSFVSYYQMLPAPGHRSVRDAEGREIDIFDPAVWRKYRWGLANPALPLPKAAAFDHLSKCLAKARQFRNALERDTVPPEGLEFFLFGGDAIPTRHNLTVDPATGVLTRGAAEPGDGKVPSASAAGDRRRDSAFTYRLDSDIPWRAVFWVPGGHMGIMNSPVFASNLRYVLLQLPVEKRR